MLEPFPPTPHKTQIPVCNRSMKTIAPLLALLIILAGCGCPHRYIPADCPDPLPAFYVPNRIRVALVLGSGGVRGIAHVGVLEELVNAGIPIDLIVGCSAGSIVGAIYADHPCIEHVKQAVWAMRSHSLCDVDLWNCRFGLSQGQSMLRVIDRDLDAETFEELAIPLVVVATDLHTGELVPIGAGNLPKAVRASCSIPLVFVPCEYGGRILVDGGVVNPVPVKLAYDLGAELVIAVDLCELLEPTFPTNLFEVGLRSVEIAFMWQNEACTRAADIVIRPKTCGVGAFNDRMKGLVYEAGKEAAREQIPVIQQLISEIPDSVNRRTGWRLIEPQCCTPAIYLDESENR